ncbi:hypothetical protein D3C71_1366820 [compost metagenome]
MAFAQVQQPVQIGAQHVRVLRAGPHGEPAVSKVGHGARRAYGRMHLVGPDVAAAQVRGGLRAGGIHIAFFDQGPCLGGVGADGGGQIVELGCGRYGLPAHLQRTHGGNGLFFTVGHHANEVALHHYLHVAGQMRDGLAVHVDQAMADEAAGVAPRMRRAHHAAVAHAGHAHVMHEAQFAGGFGGDVHARHALADDAVFAGGLQRNCLVWRRQG